MPLRYSHSNAHTFVGGSIRMAVDADAPSDGCSSEIELSCKNYYIQPIVVEPDRGRRPSYVDRDREEECNPNDRGRVATQRDATRPTDAIYEAALCGSDRL